MIQETVDFKILQPSLSNWAKGGETLSIAGDGWLEWTVNRPVPQVTVRVGRVADHMLHFKSREIRLSALAEPGSGLTFRVRKNDGSTL